MQDILTWLALVLFVVLYIRECFKNMSLADDVEAQKDKVAVLCRHIAEKGSTEGAAVLRQAPDHIGESNEMISLRREAEELAFVNGSLKASARTSDEMLMTCLTLMSSKRDNKRWAKAKIKEWFPEPVSPIVSVYVNRLGQGLSTSGVMEAFKRNIEGTGGNDVVTTLYNNPSTRIVESPIMHETVGPEC